MLRDLLPGLSQKLILAINKGALPLMPSDVVAKYSPLKSFELLFAGDPANKLVYIQTLFNVFIHFRPLA